MFAVGLDGHGSLAVLDRRVQLFKDCANRLTSSLAAESIALLPSAVAAEAQYCLNSQLSYRGYSPNLCLNGVEPRPVFEDSTACSANSLSEALPLYQAQQIRMRAVASFQDGLLQLRLSRALTSRPRASLDTQFKINDVVDFWRQTSQELSGWR